jgi:UDP-N-acetylglucosamine--N-acetylmuramyl-(pentapeptide) pyrophosphoryl-undecaprenol N-acetylglucosamine transferase
MKILLTGGGTGGHFYPIVAVIEALYEISEEQRLLAPQIVLMSDKKFDSQLITREGVIFKKIQAGKIRRYFSLLNISDSFKTMAGIIKAIGMIYSDMPDVVFGKGGYASFPVLVAARLFRIPIIIHESDSVPGAINGWASKFAKRIAISFESAAKHFPEDKTALTGTPVRKSIVGHTTEEGEEVFDLEKNVPTILVLGGSQGAQKINDAILDILDELLKSYQVIHQCGDKNLEEVTGRSSIVLENSVFKSRYHVYPFLNDSELRNASSISNIVISRAGSSAIFEIASWGLPSIIIPIHKSAQDHQRQNAYDYARTGAAAIIEEDNLTPNVLTSEINRIISDEKTKKELGEAAKRFAKPEAARKIAQEILNLALEHA